MLRRPFPLSHPYATRDGNISPCFFLRPCLVPFLSIVAPVDAVFYWGWGEKDAFVVTAVLIVVVVAAAILAVVASGTLVAAATVAAVVAVAVVVVVVLVAAAAAAAAASWP